VGSCLSRTYRWSPHVLHSSLYVRALTLLVFKSKSYQMLLLQNLPPRNLTHIWVKLCLNDCRRACALLASPRPAGELIFLTGLPSRNGLVPPTKLVVSSFVDRGHLSTKPTPNPQNHTPPINNNKSFCGKLHVPDKWTQKTNPPTSGQ